MPFINRALMCSLVTCSYESNPKTRHRKDAEDDENKSVYSANGVCFPRVVAADRVSVRLGPLNRQPGIGVATLTDPAPADAQRFYRLGVSLP